MDGERPVDLELMVVAMDDEDTSPERRAEIANGQYDPMKRAVGAAAYLVGDELPVT